MSTILRAQRPRLARELKEMLRLALPLVTGQLSAIGMNVIDAMLAGHLDAHTLGAVAVGTSVWSLALVAAIGVMLALPPSVAQLNGAGRRREIGALFRQALWLAFVLGILLMIGVHFGGPLLVVAIGVDPALVPDVTRFLHAISFGAPALTLFFALRGLSEGFGLTAADDVLQPARPRPARAGRLRADVRPARVSRARRARQRHRDRVRDVDRGARVPRCTSRRAGTTASCSLVRAFRPARVRTRSSIFCRIGVPMGVSVFMEASLFVAVALAIGTLGTDVVASHQIAINVASVTFMVPLGIAMATTVRVGHAVGRGDARACATPGSPDCA